MKSENITSSVSGKNDGTVKLKELELMELFEQTLDPQKSGLIPASELKHILISIYLNDTHGSAMMAKLKDS